MEYHKGNEVLVAVTDLLLILGRLQDVKDFTYESSKAVAFYVPTNTAVELYSTTLHYAPALGSICSRGLPCTDA